MIQTNIRRNADVLLNQILFESPFRVLPWFFLETNGLIYYRFQPPQCPISSIGTDLNGRGGWGESHNLTRVVKHVCPLLHGSSFSNVSRFFLGVMKRINRGKISIKWCGFYWRKFGLLFLFDLISIRNDGILFDVLAKFLEYKPNSMVC